MSFWVTGGNHRLAFVAGFLYGVFILLYLRPVWWQGLILWLLGSIAWPGDTTLFTPVERQIARAVEISIAAVVILWIALLIIE